MTTWDVLRILGRRWYLLGLGMVATLLSCVYVYHASPVYLTSTDVYISPPPGTNPAVIGSFTQSTIAVTGLVERRVNDASARRAVSPDVTLVDMGIYHGTMVSLPNSGGQWTYSFAEPRLRVSAAAGTAGEAEALREAASRAVERELAALQIEDGVPPSERYVSRLIPAVPQVTLQQGRRSLAAATVLALGSGLTIFLTVQLGRMLDRRRAPNRSSRA